MKSEDLERHVRAFDFAYETLQKTTDLKPIKMVFYKMWQERKLSDRDWAEWTEGKDFE